LLLVARRGNREMIPKEENGWTEGLGYRYKSPIEDVKRSVTEGSLIKVTRDHDKAIDQGRFGWKLDMRQPEGGQERYNSSNLGEERDCDIYPNGRRLQFIAHKSR
jgi:hypothetical protein